MKRGPNPYCTTFQVLEQLTQAHSTAELLSALRHPRLPRSVREVLRFGHSSDDIDLPKACVGNRFISTRAYVEDNDAPFDLDLLRFDSENFPELYCKSSQPFRPPPGSRSIYLSFQRPSASSWNIHIHRGPAQSFAMICRSIVKFGVLDDYGAINWPSNKLRFPRCSRPTRELRIMVRENEVLQHFSRRATRTSRFRNRSLMRSSQRSARLQNFRTSPELRQGHVMSTTEVETHSGYNGLCGGQRPRPREVTPASGVGPIAPRLEQCHERILDPINQISSCCNLYP